MMNAARLAAKRGEPINRLLTIRVAGLCLAGDGGILRTTSTSAARVVDLLNRLARWFRARGLPVVALWVREYCRHHGEHLHIGFHMPPRFDAALASQIALWLDEPIGEHDGHQATIAQSEYGSWQIRGCLKGGTSGEYIAAYLGKSEPNDYLTAWGKTRKNDEKVRRSERGGEGPINGTGKHYYRWGTSLAVGRSQRASQGLV